jgi:hypothetical protein
MAAADFPYVTLLDVLHRPMELIDEKALADACQHKWYNQTLCEVNDSVVRLGVVEGRTITLEPRQGVVIPKGVMHRPRAPQRTVMLMVETRAIVPTGN